MAELNVPDRLALARSQVVEGFLSGDRNTPAEKKLKAWLLSDAAHGEIVEGDDPIGVICDLRYPDEEIRSHLGLGSRQAISDNHRAAFARDLIDQAREDPSIPWIDARSISSENGRTCFIGLSSVAEGQGGMSFSWLGIFPSPLELIRSLEDQGYAVNSIVEGGSRFDNYSDDQLARMAEGESRYGWS